MYTPSLYDAFKRNITCIVSRGHLTRYVFTICMSNVAANFQTSARNKGEQIDVQDMQVPSVVCARCRPLHCCGLVGIALFEEAATRLY